MKVKSNCEFEFEVEDAVIGSDIEQAFEKHNDFVMVTRCKDCKHLMFSDCYGECSRGYLGIVLPDDFCSRGERKDGEGE